jgi:hypothetical protein
MQEDPTDNFLKKAQARPGKREQPSKDEVEQKTGALSEKALKKNNITAHWNCSSYRESPETKTLFNPVANESVPECLLQQYFHLLCSIVHFSSKELRFWASVHQSLADGYTVLC